ncbi:hypothetical protein [Pseudomonas sp. zfem002]|uniref:hypothetical protein n=1 Tax=Pseudomonas sp. zfem002 TaxID=3078197 RepID=UPI002929A4F0|nr:hypothetical protein [Pseudomonas sp. zfem002]MDU9392124.1 hypothetical protein [Pseudomonas sp. zfem002]
METRDFEELAGRIEGLARCVMILTGSLQREGHLNQQKLQADLRIASQGLQADIAGCPTVISTLNEMADQLLADYQYCLVKAS